MNILVFGPFYANAKHGAEVGVVAGLKELGHHVSVYDHRANAYLSAEGLKLQTHDERLLFEVVKNDAVDVVLVVGPGIPDEVTETKIWKKNNDKLKILWSSEPIRLEEYKSKMIKQKNRFHLFFTFDESEIPLYRDLGINASFLPQAYNPNWYYPMPIPTNQCFNGYFVFIGSIGGKWLHRQHLLNKVRALGYKINVASIMDAERVNKAYNMHDATLNLGLYVPGESGSPEDLVSFGLQQRIFESIGAGKVCVTNEICRETNKLFEHKKNILCYNKDNLPEVLEIASNKREIKRMEEEVEKIRELHNYKARMEQMIRTIDW